MVSVFPLLGIAWWLSVWPRGSSYYETCTPYHGLCKVRDATVMNVLIGLYIDENDGLMTLPKPKSLQQTAVRRIFTGAMLDQLHEVQALLSRAIHEVMAPRTRCSRRPLLRPYRIVFPN